MGLEALGGRFGTGHGAVEGHLVPGQQVNEEIRSGAGADADDALLIELGEDEVDGGLGNGLLELVLGHAGEVRMEECRGRGL
ncbi:hypothetical protein D3C86_1854870 [compost metagenome]